MQQILRMPEVLCEENMDEVVRQHGQEAKKYGLDLFVGSESRTKSVEGSPMCR